MPCFRFVNGLIPIKRTIVIGGYRIYKMTKIQKEKPGDAAMVEAYMADLQHPLKQEIELIRSIIKATDMRIKERIKWNAPSYFYKEDMLTFNHRAEEFVHLIFHHPAIETINSPILVGDYVGRRMCYFKDKDQIQKQSAELQKVLRQLIEIQDSN